MTTPLRDYAGREPAPPLSYRRWLWWQLLDRVSLFNPFYVLAVLGLIAGLALWGRY